MDDCNVGWICFRVVVEYISIVERSNWWCSCLFRWLRRKHGNGKNSCVRGTSISSLFSSLYAFLDVISLVVWCDIIFYHIWSSLVLYSSSLWHRRRILAYIYMRLSFISGVGYVVRLYGWCFFKLNKHRWFHGISANKMICSEREVFGHWSTGRRNWWRTQYVVCF